MDLKETEILGDAINSHWYYQAKAGAMLSLLDKASIQKVLDVGAGAAFFSKYLLSNTNVNEVSCVDIGYEQDSDATAFGKKISFRKAITESDADLVLLMDVLEHVDDDQGLLSDYVSKVPKGTTFLVTVPAFQFMWSEHDEYLEHKRRYTLEGLESVVRRCDLEIQSAGYLYGLVFPLAFLTRIIENLKKSKHIEPRSQLKVHSPLINGLLARLCKIEAPWIKRNRYFGLSVYCVAKKI